MTGSSYRLSIQRRHLGLLGLILAAILGWSGLLDLAATRGPVGAVQDGVAAYLDRSEKMAVEAFAAARTINAAVSVLKSADLSAVVAQVAPMEVLEPVDDLAKQFSDVMVVSIVAILIERLVLLVSQAWALSVLLPVGCVLLATASLLRSSPGQGMGPGRRLAAIGRFVILLALFTRFVVLAAGWAGDGLTRRFLAADLTQSIAMVHSSEGRLAYATQAATQPAQTTQPAEIAPAPPPPTAAGSMFDQFWRDVSKTLQSAVTGTSAAVGRGAALVQSARSWIPDQASISAILTALPDQIVKAIEIFLVQTVLTPVLVALFFYGVLRSLLRPVA